MFLYLSKLLPNFIYPLGLSCLLIILGLIFRRRRWQRVSLVLALLLLFAGGNRLVALALARSLEWRYLPQPDLPSAEVIVVLGGGALAAQYPRPMVEVDSAGDRLIYAAHLYRLGKSSHLLLCGGSLEWLPDSEILAEDMQRFLEEFGVPSQALWLETTSRNTYENAVNARAFLQTKGIHRIILVTSAAHMPRSVALFEKQGFEVIPAPTDFTVTQASWENLTHASAGTFILSMLPGAENLSITTRMLKEYLGMLIYRLNGWM